MNLIITNRCHGSCDYCFAKRFTSTNTIEFLSERDYRFVVEFLRNSEIPVVKLLGGEPFLHPQISKFIQLIEDDPFFERIIVFTGGMFEIDLEPILKKSDKTNIVFNLNATDRYTGRQMKVVEKNLRELCFYSDVTLSVNFSDPNGDYIYAFDAALIYGIGKIRWSVANPHYLDKARIDSLDQIGVIKQFGSLVHRFLVDAQELGFDLTHDCQVPFCSFNDEEIIGLPRRGLLSSLQNLCSLALVIGPDLRI